MTDVLRETLEERGRARPWEDVEGLLAAGDRRVRRRRLTVGAGALAGVVALVVAAPYVVGAVGRDGSGQVAGEPAFDTTQPSWVDGSVLNVGDDEVTLVELDDYPVAYVLTDEAAVVVAPDGSVDLYDGGDRTEIGSVGDAQSPRLLADGSLVAWYDQDAEAVVAYDTAADEEVRRVASPMPTGDRFPFGIPEVRALDGTDLWYSTLGEVHGVDVRTGEEFRTVEASIEGTAVVDAGGGRVVTYTPVEGVEVTARDGEVVATLPDRLDDGLLSPDGSLLVGTATRGAVRVDRVDGLDGGSVTVRSGYRSVAVTRWLDDDRFQAVGGLDDPDVIVCSVAAASCDPVARDVPRSRLAVPDGSGAHSYG